MHHQSFFYTCIIQFNLDPKCILILFQVEIVRATSINFQFDPLFDSENIEGTEYTAKFRGYLHPLGADSSNGPPLKVFLVSVSAHAWLYVSTDDSPLNVVISFHS